MPVQWEAVEITLQGLDEKSDRASVPMGKLVTAENIVFEATGRLDKRRGYLRMQTTDDVVGGEIDPRNLFCAAATAGDELVVFALDRCYTVGSRADAIDGAGLIDRGPAGRCMLEIQHVSTGKETV